MTPSPRPSHDQTGEQHELLPGLVRAEVARARKASATRARKAAQAPVAAVDPVARVLVDLPLAHLDRPFDYSVPEAMAEAARPGVRVKVRFAGQDVDGFLVERRAVSDHAGSLTAIRRVVSPEPVLTPAVAGLSEDVARRYAGTRSDVLRLAVPPRHATVEKQASEPAAPTVRSLDLPAAERAWSGHSAAPAYLQHLADGGEPAGGVGRGARHGLAGPRRARGRGDAGRRPRVAGGRPRPCRRRPGRRGALARSSATASTSSSRLTRDRPGATASSWRSSGAPAAWSWAPGRRRSPRSTTWGCS